MISVDNQRVSGASVWSVMIPTYRPSLNYLRETIESVLCQAQDPALMQIEVVDDCSPDVDVAEMVVRIAGRRVAVYRNPANLGLAGCWNSCISRARGEIVHILHQDDTVLPGFYDALEAGFRSDASIGAAFTRHAYFDGDGHWYMLSELESRLPGILPNFLTKISAGNVIQCASVAVRKEVYQTLGDFCVDRPHTLDWEMWVRIAARFSFYYDPRLLACYRMHDSSMTARQVRNGEQLTDVFRAINHNSTHLDKRTARKSRRVYAGHGLDMVRSLICRGEFDAALLNLQIVLQNCRDPAIWTHPAVGLTALKLWTKLQIAKAQRIESSN